MTLNAPDFFIFRLKTGGHTANSIRESSSIVLQKMRHFYYGPFIFESSSKLAALAGQPTDMYLPDIVQLQRYSEEVDDIITDTTNVAPVDEINAKIMRVREKLDLFKSTLRFSLSDCRRLQSNR